MNELINAIAELIGNILALGFILGIFILFLNF